MKKAETNETRSAGVILEGVVYRLAASKTFDERYLKNEGVDFFIYALVCSKKKPKLDLFRPVGKKSSLPSEISKDLSAEQKEYADKHKAKGHLWFLKLEEGWDWTKAGGDRGARKVQDVLTYLKKFKSKDRVGGVEAIYVEINNKPKKAKKQKAAGARPFYPAVKTAGWWSEDPLGGDTPLDMLAVLEKTKTPQEGARLVRIWFEADSPSMLYSALGIWDLVMTTGPQEWKDAFEKLRVSIPAVADKALHYFAEDDGKDPDDEYANIWGQRYLEKYMDGQTGIVKYNESFHPGGGQWVIEDAAIPYYDEDMIEVSVDVVYRGERDTKNETINAPSDAAEINSVSVMNYGGEGTEQQSLVVTVDYTDADGNDREADIQMDLDSNTGQFRESDYE